MCQVNPFRQCPYHWLVQVVLGPDAEASRNALALIAEITLLRGALEDSDEFIKVDSIVEAMKQVLPGFEPGPKADAMKTQAAEDILKSIHNNITEHAIRSEKIQKGDPKELDGAYRAILELADHYNSTKGEIRVNIDPQWLVYREPAVETLQ